MVRQTHLDNEIGDQFTLACIHLNQSAPNWLNVLCVIDSSFDREFEKHKFVEFEDSRKENKNPVSMWGSLHRISTKKLIVRYKVFSPVKLPMISLFDMESTSLLLSCL